MPVGWLIVAAALVLAAWLLLQPLWAARQRRRLAARPLPASWRELLRRDVPLYRHLPPPLAERFEGQVQVFCAEKRFHGCDGFALDERAQLAVAGHACLLRLQPGADCYPEVREILLYPTAFWVHHEQPDEFGLVDDEPDLLAGEAWQHGRVILSWEDIAGALAGEPHNVVVHEFAHQVDFESPGAEGAPQLADYGEWARVFTHEFERLRANGSPVIDAYGAENPAEFFAVAAEAYIQDGPELAHHHGELYRLLRDYFLIDTAAAGHGRHRHHGGHHRQ